LTSELTVSVLMGVYNGNPNHIKEAIHSILEQDWRDFEFLIIDDGSKPEIHELLTDLAKQDDRISLMTNKVNMGLTRSLNAALKKAKGNFIARMDADDICVQGRLSAQVAFLHEHPHVGVVGGRFTELINGVQIPQRLPFISHAKEIRKRIIRFNPLCHSSIMARRVALMELGGYDEVFKHAQDYDLWLRVVRKWDIQNIDQVFIIRRMEDGISIHAEQSQRRYALKARWRALIRGDYFVSAIFALAWYSVALLAGNRGQMLFRKLREQGNS
jgi:glycosyltransferase involved in cell wall biosynthesis